MRKCCFFDILFLYCFLLSWFVCIYGDIQIVTELRNRLAKFTIDADERK